MATERSCTLLIGQDASAEILASTQTEANSYEQELIIGITTFAGWLNSDGPKNVKEIVSSLFGEDGLISLLLKLSGKGPKSLEKGRASKIVININGDNNTVVISPDTAKLYNDKHMRAAVERAMRPLQQNSVKQIQFTSDHKTVSVGRSDFDFFQEPVEPIPLTPEKEGETVFDTVTIIKPSFDKDKRYKLRSERFGDFGALMQDMSFQKKVSERKILFGTGDRLNVRMWVRRYSETTEFFITHVLNDKNPDGTLMGFDFG